MSSQPSTSSVSDLTSYDHGIVSFQDLSRHVIVIQDLQGIQLLNVTSTTEKAHLSNIILSAQYTIKLCSRTRKYFKIYNKPIPGARGVGWS